MMMFINLHNVMLCLRIQSVICHNQAFPSALLPILQKLQAIRQTSDKDRSKLEKKFKDRLKDMDVKIKALHKKERDNMHLERLKAKSEETCARLNSDILGIKQQKVAPCVCL